MCGGDEDHQNTHFKAGGQKRPSLVMRPVCSAEWSPNLFAQQSSPQAWEAFGPLYKEGSLLPPNFGIFFTIIFLKYV